MKLLIKCLVFVGLFLGLERFCRSQTDGFALTKLAPAQEKGIYHGDIGALSQRFIYLGKGGQSYVFISEDGQLVLKFFRWPFSLRKQMRLKESYESSQLAYARLKEETGLIALHLGTTQGIAPLTIVDKLKIAHTIDPNGYGWILQKKAVLVRERIAKLMQDGDLDGAKNALSALFTLIEKIRGKKVADGDPNLTKNFGFVGNEAIQIDIGRFTHDDSPSLAEVATSKEDLQHWLNAHFPALSSHLSDK